MYNSQDVVKHHVLGRPQFPFFFPQSWLKRTNSVPRCVALSKLIASWLLPTLLPNSGAQISHLEHANSLFTDLPVCGLKLTHIQPSPCNENQFSSVSFWPHGLQHARLPCPSPIPRAHSNSHPSSDRCHPTISSSVIPFSSCLQSFPTSGSFLMSWLLTSGVQSIGASASASVLPMNI